MLESLRQGAGNIHQLNLEGAFPEPVLYRPRELYEELKRTPLYDTERGQWNWSISEEQELKDTDRDARAQLLGVLVEAQFNPEGAWALYEKLKAGPLYDAQYGQWNWGMSREQRLESTDRFALDQLLGVLVEAQLNPEEARALYENLKATPLYDAERGQWNWYMSNEQELGDTYRDAAAQLLEVLVEVQLNPEGARALYEKLKATPLYDAQRGQWNSMMSEEQELKDTRRCAENQLLGVLVEAQFNPEGARALYEMLKATPLFDAQCAQWNWHISEKQELKDTRRCAESQLLAVLVEAKLLATLPRPLLEAIPPLPITEDW